jgi:hypothetical protein
MRGVRVKHPKRTFVASAHHSPIAKKRRLLTWFSPSPIARSSSSYPVPGYKSCGGTLTLVISVDTSALKTRSGILPRQADLVAHDRHRHLRRIGRCGQGRRLPDDDRVVRIHDLGGLGWEDQRPGRDHVGNIRRVGEACLEFMTMTTGLETRMTVEDHEDR